MQFTVGSVPYVNARPLVGQFRHLGDQSPVRVIYKFPSELPALIDAGEVQAALVSSFDALRSPGRKVGGGCVSTFGEAQSVRLFSRVPFDQIRSLALDKSSLTSIHLAQVVLAESYGLKPETRSLAPDLDSMLSACDAAVIIGDKGMLARADGLHVLDLGSAWASLTSLPFVWAAWIGGEAFDEELAGLLEEANAWGQEHLDEVIEDTQREVHWPGDSCRRYLAEIMNYNLTDRHLDGLWKFQELLVKNGLLEQSEFPEVVRATARA